MSMGRCSDGHSTISLMKRIITILMGERRSLKTKGRRMNKIYALHTLIFIPLFLGFSDWAIHGIDFWGFLVDIIP